ncbi:MAG: glycosyltransferase family 2 protein [Ferrimicrobium sp.]
MQISAVIPTYNAEDTIAATLRSVIDQSRPPDEIIVVDDASTDNTISIVSEVAPNATLLHQENSGPSVARNRGINYATGDLIAFVDDDDIWHPTKLAAQLSCLQQHPELDLIATSWRRDYPTPTPNPTITWLTYHDLLVLNRFQTSTVLVRRELVQAVGGFDSDLDSVEDWDLWMRMATKGSLAILESPLVLYRDSPNGVSKNLRRFGAAMQLLLTKEGQRTDLSQNEYATICAWHAQRMAVALLLDHDPTGAIGALRPLSKLGSAANILATRQHLFPFLLERVKRRYGST